MTQTFLYVRWEQLEMNQRHLGEKTHLLNDIPHGFTLKPQWICVKVTHPERNAKAHHWEGETSTEPCLTLLTLSPPTMPFTPLNLFLVLTLILLDPYFRDLFTIE